ncbi:MAG: L,D-transpeptidase, partial [Burkholderiales bacterium]
AYYAHRIEGALAAEKLELAAPQFILLVDRSRWVQAALLYWMSGDKRFHFIGATPATTGLPGRFEYYATPLGVFNHSVDNPDFRAEGTRNNLGILGYGEKGMRVYDFGWVNALRGWGPPKESLMRLQLHATDPALLEPKLGRRASKGCIRIPASLNIFLDRYGILDADYERALREGEKPWVLRAGRTPAPWPGRYLIVVESQRNARPSWSPAPPRGSK